MWRATEVQEAMRQGHQGGGRWLPLGTDIAQELFQGVVREHCRLSCVAGLCNLRPCIGHLHTRVLLGCHVLGCSLARLHKVMDKAKGSAGELIAEGGHFAERKPTCCREHHSKAEQAAGLHQQGQARRHVLLAHNL